MDSELASLIDELRQRRDALCAKVARLPEQKQNAAPKRNAWSPNQILEHMGRAEATYLEMLDQSPRGSLPRIAVRNSLPFKAVCWFLRNALPAPTIKSMEPSEGMPAENAAEYWRETNEKLIASIENQPADEPVLKHPVLGLMSPRQVIEILGHHLTYHERRFPV